MNIRIAFLFNNIYKIYFFKNILKTINFFSEHTFLKSEKHDSENTVIKCLSNIG